MELNKSGKDELRERIETKLKDIEFNPEKRIKLPLERLEKILFDYKTDDKGNIIKLIGYTGNNLCKLDLSEVSFEDVSLLKHTNFINFSNTNINLLFEDLYEAKENSSLLMTRVNFENVDLSDNEKGSFFKKISGSIANCNFINTKLNLDCLRSEFIGCNFSNLNLEDLIIKPVGMRSDNDGKHSLVLESNNEQLFFDCNFKNTRVRININNMSYNHETGLKTLLDKNYLDGCFINDKYVKSNEEKTSTHNDILRKYNSFKTNYINDTIDMIDSQLSSVGGRQSLKKKELTLTFDPKSQDDGTWAGFETLN